MVNTSALKNGRPPSRGKTSENIIEADTRKKEEKNKPLQVMIPPKVFNDFSTEAGKIFGVNKGAKSQFFLLLWEKYISMK